VPDRRLVTVPHFGDVAIADGEIVVRDAGTQGVQGHAVRVGKGGLASWERRSTGLEPDGDAVAGEFSPTDEERRDLARWADVAWRLCEGPKPPPRLTAASPRWVWCVVVRRGNEARWLTDHDNAPDELRPLLDWLTRRVDALAEAPS